MLTLYLEVDIDAEVTALANVLGSFQILADMYEGDEEKWFALTQDALE